MPYSCARLRIFLVPLAPALLAISFVAAQAKTPKPCASSLAACSTQGCSKPGVLPPDPELDVQKNRTQPPAQFHAYTFSAFIKLNQEAVLKKQRPTWTDAESQRVRTIENGDGASLVGYLHDATLSDPETCNCYLADESGRDFHIWLGRTANPAAGDYIVVEMTPRIREAKPAWTLQKLTTLKKQHPKVRVRGIITYDNEHFDYPKRHIRATAWEIHPVTNFEVCPTSQCTAQGTTGWVKLEDLHP